MDSIVLIAIREYQKDKADIIHVYSASQIEVLKKNNELPINFYENYTEDNLVEDMVFIGENDMNVQDNFENLPDISVKEETLNDDEINLEDI